MTSQARAFREVICDDAINWLQSFVDTGKTINGSVFTSLPDISEIHSALSATSPEDRVINYEQWFRHAVCLAMKLVTDGNYVIFLQSDVRVQSSDGNVLKWIDKSYLCTESSAICGCTLMWHKIVYSGDLWSRSAGRPNYSHLLCYGKNVSYDSGQFSTPDIFDRGPMLWPKGIGLNCCFTAVAFLKQIAQTSLIIDPFCGYGTVLAMSNALGIPSLGVEISAKRCRRARSLCLIDAIKGWSRGHMSMLGLPKSVILSWEDSSSSSISSNSNINNATGQQDTNNSMYHTSDMTAARFQDHEEEADSLKRSVRVVDDDSEESFLHGLYDDDDVES